MPDTTASFSNGRANAVIDSLRGIGSITIGELHRIDPISFDQVARRLQFAGVRYSNDTVIEFGEVQS